MSCSMSGKDLATNAGITEAPAMHLTTPKLELLAISCVVLYTVFDILERLTHYQIHYFDILEELTQYQIR